jgi:hypothetical protein
MKVPPMLKWPGRTGPCTGPGFNYHPAVAVTAFMHTVVIRGGNVPYWF